MPVTVVVGLQWGDEGKGKIVDCLTRDMDVVVRYQGGANAGHTVVVGEDERVLHLLPSGVLHPGVENVIGNGLVVDPDQLLREIDALASKGITLEGRLMISERAHLVFPYHRWQDRAADKRAGDARVGTTRRGIGPAYADKVSRHTAFRFLDLRHPEAFRKKLHRVVEEKTRWLRTLGEGEPLDADALATETLGHYDRLKGYVGDASRYVKERIAAGKRILMEGAQGSLLDVDYGTYPYVTSSNTVALAAPLGIGIPLRAITEVVGVIKAYTTRVGEGPFPTELAGKDGAGLRERGAEYGATTGRPRRCGWFDAVAGRYTIDLNGVDRLCLTKLDVLDEADPIRVCTGYRLDGEALETFPADTELLPSVEPVYEDVPGWMTTTTDITEWDDLPQLAKAYVGFLESKLEAPISRISIGRRRDQLIER